MHTEARGWYWVLSWIAFCLVFLEQAFTEPGAPGLSKMSWPASSGSSVSVSPAEGYKHSSLHPVFYVGAEIQAQALMLTMAGTSF